MLRLALMAICILLLGCAGKSQDVNDGLKPTFGPLLIDQPFGDNRLLMSGGLSGVVQVCGFELRIVRNGKVLFERGASEADPDVRVQFPGDYSDSGMLKLTHYTWDYRSPEADGLVPFMSETVSLVQGDHIKIDRKLLLQPEPATSAQIRVFRDAAIEYDKSDKPDDYDKSEECLQHLRNIGMALPDEVLTVFDGLDQSIEGCATQESLGQYEREVEMAKEIKAKPTVFGEEGD